jgi:hypothetical protein
LVVVAVNVPVVEPAATVMVAGTVTSLVAAERLTVKVPVGAEVNVTVPVVVHPAVTVLGERLSETIASLSAVKIAFAEECAVVA